MKQRKLSGPAIFMYSAIVVTAVLAVLFLTLYYANVWHTDLCLWFGIVPFMILYHFGLRILFGEITGHCKIRYEHPFFCRKKFEAPLYRFLRVRQWKDRVLTFNPEHYDTDKRTLSELAQTMAKSETDHWINEIISLSSLAFILLWGEWLAFVLTAFVAMVFDAQFILVQRYNRPIVMRLMKRYGKDAILGQNKEANR